MIQKTVYCCEFCEKQYNEQSDCESCEAWHFNLNRKQYLDWRILNKDVANAGKLCGILNNERTRKALDNAVHKLIDFEKKHGIKEGVKKPKDFYF